MASKKVRHIKNIGSVYFDNTKQQWIGQVEIGKYANGRVKYKRFVGDSQEDVIYRMKRFKEENIVAVNPSPMETILFDAYMETYLNTIKRTKLKPASFVRDCQTYKNNIKPYLGGYDIHEITPAIIQNNLINSLINDELSYSSIHKAYVLTNECLNYAYKQQVIEKNPCSLVDKPSKNGLQKTKEVRFLNDAEIKRFIDIALERSKNGSLVYTNGYAFVILIYTGLRMGEMIALKWNNVDLENNYIKVNSNVGVKYNDDLSKTESFIQDSTKTKKSRIVHLTKSAAKYFTELKNLRNPKPNDFVVVSDIVNRNFTILRGSYASICRKADIDNPQGLHTLRHTFASLMIRKGVDIKIISEMLGHSSVSFTYNTYVHLIEEEKAKVIRQLDI